MDEVKQFMRKLEDDKTARAKDDFRVAKLKNDIKRMSYDRMSVERSGNLQRIKKFNILFVSKLSELSQLLQKNGNSNREDIARLVRNIKAQ